jgi:hypothetical protein
MQTAEANRDKKMPNWARRYDDLGLWDHVHAWAIREDDLVYVTVTVHGHDRYTDHLDPDQRQIIQKLAKERMIAKGSSSGWVTPSGEWFPVESYNHDAFAEFFFGRHVAEIERNHARVKGPFWTIEGGRVTPAMSQRLKRMGFVDVNGDLHHRRDL